MPAEYPFAIENRRVVKASQVPWNIHHDRDIEGNFEIVGRKSVAVRRTPPACCQTCWCLSILQKHFTPLRRLSRVYSSVKNYSRSMLYQQEQQQELIARQLCRDVDMCCDLAGGLKRVVPTNKTIIDTRTASNRRRIHARGYCAETEVDVVFIVVQVLSSFQNCVFLTSVPRGCAASLALD